VRASQRRACPLEPGIAGALVKLRASAAVWPHAKSSEELEFRGEFARSGVLDAVRLFGEEMPA
jgi:hypothetical protein